MSYRIKRIDLICLAIFILYTGGAQLFAAETLPKILINEIMASNSQTLEDPETGDFSDWFELYNSENTSVDISGWFVTDNFNAPEKWQIPAGTVMSAGDYFVFMADGLDSGLHTNFKLSADGEEIALYTSAGVLADSISFSRQTSDISYGLFPDGGSARVYFDLPTPGSPNSAAAYEGIVSTPVFSLKGGFYAGSQSIEITKGDFLEDIRYTLDGSVPDLNSSIYLEALDITATAVLRVRCFRDGYLPSSVITHTYFIDETTTLPVVSVVTDPDNLWDDEKGIYVQGTNGVTGYCMSEPCNWNQPWERPISLEMYEANGEFGFKIDAGMRIGGGCTRKYPQKTLAIYARAKYGFSKIEYPVFQDKNIDSFNNLNLRNGGQDWWRGMFRDGMMHTLVNGEMDIDWQAYKPAIVFLNGDYWGIHGIREKHNEHYLESNYGIDPDSVDILSGSTAYVKHGSSEHYDSMIDFIENHNLAVSSCYDYVASQMDINEYINYMISEIYFANIDWPGGNIKFWRQQGSDHKWRWILFDTDLGFGAHERGQYYSNSLANVMSETQTYYANPSSSTFLFRNLLKNSDFKNEFIQRSAGYLNTVFEPQRVLGIIDSLKLLIEPEMPRHIQKWEQSTSFNDGWAYHVDIMEEFAVERPASFLDHIMENFDLSGTAELNVAGSDPKMGRIILSGVNAPDSGLCGSWLKDIPIRCVAVPADGYHFAGWQGVSSSLEDTLYLTLNTDSDLEAIFEAGETDIIHDLPENMSLAQNYPNPFNPLTTIPFTVSKTSQITLTIYDITGRLVATLLDEEYSAGEYSITWNASLFSTGLYIYRMESSEGIVSQKMLLIR